MVGVLGLLFALALPLQDAEADAAGDALIACSPVTLDSAIGCLDDHWTSRDEFKALSYDDISMVHRGFGMWMRNNWGLWGGGPLAKSFNEMGIRHPDDMSGIILTSYWLHLHECPLRVPEQVAYYRAYWALPEGSDVSAHLDSEPSLDCTSGANAQ
jgi:hypothetical protein